ncbi:hypothetical protein EPN28_01550 [Patescibacteria group bacterium]|nr:MAG: hypothetical protein EPN28_01550 [Patescibacteria group bacterium]
MFKHKYNDEPQAGDEKRNEEKKEGAENAAPAPRPAEPAHDGPEALRELVEKNLKWSQIIYEQNRRINRKLFWSAFLGWFKFLIIVGSLILGAWYLQPYLKGLLNQYGQLMGIIGGGQSGQEAPASSVEEMMKILNLNPEQQERAKGLLK